MSELIETITKKRSTGHKRAVTSQLPFTQLLQKEVILPKSDGVL